MVLRGRRSKIEELHCVHCGSPIIGRKRQSIYCSEKCAGIYRSGRWRKNNPDKVVESRRKEREKLRRTPEETRERAREYFKKNKEKLQSQRKEYYRNNRILRNLRTIKYKCKAKDIPFDLEESDIIVPEYCPILGIKLEYNEDRGKFNSPSIDRIKPELGYVKGNIRVISNRANTLKNNMTLEEVELIHKDIERITKGEQLD